MLFVVYETGVAAYGSHGSRTAQRRRIEIDVEADGVVC